jgi:glycosyltransferase involved in cell wall biosynthesis
VSVVIPCYNQAHFLVEAIQSILAQSYPRVEIVVVDDGSTDDTSDVAARYPEVRLVRQDNQGLSAARNAGLRESEGEYVVFLDADDRLLPEALEVGLECMEANPECAFASGHCILIGPDGSPLFVPQQFRVERDHYIVLLRNNYIWNPATVIYRRYILGIVDGLDTSLSPAADYDLYLRIAKDFPVQCHDKVIAEYRQHGANMSGDSTLMLNAILRFSVRSWNR